MHFKRHSELEGRHSVLSASKNSWLNYTDERLFEYVDNMQASIIGTKQHAYAAMAIELGNKQPNSTKTLNAYINDAIGFRMKPEVILCYSQFAFGTADAIGFRDRVLRIFDLKTGVKPAGGTQLAVYAAYFCLEYKIKPFDIEFDLRIYQNDEIVPILVTSEDIAHIMSRITELNELLTNKMAEEV